MRYYCFPTIRTKIPIVSEDLVGRADEDGMGRPASVQVLLRTDHVWNIKDAKQSKVGQYL
jgi:hypothetical protein